MGKNKTKKQAKTEINKLFLREYETFLNNYLFRLLGLVNMKVIHSEQYFPGENIPAVEQDARAIYFSVDRWRVFKLDIKKGTTGLSEDNLRLANRVIQEFLPMTEYKWSGGKLNSAYPTSNKHGERGVHQHTIYNLAIQKGICSWVADSSSFSSIDKLFHILETWSVKTYEGKNVTLSIIIDPDGNSSFDTRYGDFLSFMEDDVAAVLTDGIHSAVELDSNCNFIQHISVSTNGTIPPCQLCCSIPLRFTQLVKQYVYGKKVGIFLLSNGDIILAKNQSIRFVKRNLQWLNFSYDAFCNALGPFLKKNEKMISSPLIEEVFASVLDVSFSHTGGIVAIIGEAWNNAKHPATEFTTHVLNEYDNLLSPKNSETLYKKPGLELTEKKKRLLKRNALMQLTEGKRFQNLDRKLRSELMALDGACILNCFGDVYAFGAIIQNDSGSTGGGRSAAAKKLSNYGMAVKISTDGYIELYVNQKIVYEIK